MRTKGRLLEARPICWFDTLALAGPLKEQYEWLRCVVKDHLSFLRTFFPMREENRLDLPDASSTDTYPPRPVCWLFSRQAKD